MNCVVCQANKKYKCSQCRLPYCSASCYQIHKKDCAGQPAIIPPPQPVQSFGQTPLIKTDYLSDEELRIPPEKLKLLGQDPKLKEMLMDIKLRNRLMAIDNSKQRMTAVQQAMEQDNFYALFQQVLNVLQLQEE